jgi:hypothetical protein
MILSVPYSARRLIRRLGSRGNVSDLYRRVVETFSTTRSRGRLRAAASRRPSPTGRAPLLGREERIIVP